MSYLKRQKNRKRRQTFRTITISFIFLYLILRSAPILIANNAKTILPEKGTLINTISTEGVLIKHETVIKANNNGIVEHSSIEGERIAAGTEVANINSLTDTSSLRQELVQIEESIEALEKSTTETSLLIMEKEKIETVKDDLVLQLQNMIISGQYDKIYILKEQLALYEDKAKDVSFTNTLVGQSLENLIIKKENINEEINKNHIKYYTSHGGIISYNIDGYEEVFLPKEFENYTYDKLKIDSNIPIDKGDETITIGQPICKVIDNFQWFLALKIEDIKEIEDFKVNNTLKIKFKDSDEEQNGKIIAINFSGNKAIIIVELNNMLHNYYNIRFSEVDIIKSKKDGYKIPTEAIIDKNSEQGVYIKDKSGIVKFRKLTIIGQDLNYTYVDVDDIGLFDEIFISPKNIKEGQILN